MKKHYDEIDILKGIAIFLVVVGHGVILYPVNLHNVILTSRIYEWVESVHMPLFFLLAGFTFSYHEGYWRKKAKRILVPYLAFCLLDILLKSTLPMLVNKQKPLTEHIYDVFCGGGGYWFLYVLMVFYLVSPVLLLLVRKLSILRLLWFPVALCLPFVPGIPEIFLLRLTAHYAPYFAAGVVVRYYVDRHAGINESSVRQETDRLHSGQYYFLAMIVLGLWAVIKFGNGTAIYTVLYVLGAFSGILFFYLLVRSGFFRPVEQFLKDWGKLSLQIYLLDSYLLVVSRTLICRVLGEGQAFWILLFNVVFDLGGALLLIHFVLGKAKVLKFLSGML
ncbi:MAG: acyltransferase [Lachnospiraceae bacterium]|nr:acyltransferase [Lachnospiraceae bacterium]